MNKSLQLLLLLGGGFLLYKYLQGDFSATPVEPLPQGAQLTGETTRTTNAGAPGEEVVGYGIRDWAKVLFPTGHTDWVEVRVNNPWSK